jgi:hypothetical protein
MISRTLPAKVLLFILVVTLLSGCGARAGAQRRNSVSAKSLPEISVSGPVQWQADFESGDLLQWRVGSGANSPAEFDSGKCTRPENGVTTEQAHSGKYSMKLTIDTSVQSGCRQFRWVESNRGEPLYYSAWFYFPQKAEAIEWWDIFQFKSKVTQGGKSTSEPFWFVEVVNNPRGDMQLGLVWKDAQVGPAREYFTQNIATLPVGQWVHIEVYLKQSEQMDGQIIVWQDGVELFNVTGVRTKHVGGEQSWSVNNYAEGVYPSPISIYIDDAAISTERLGPK